jgi:hypothetical protein
MTAEKFAKLFHDTYEQLAPEFGYETRNDTKDFDSLSKNGRLMIAVCESVMMPALDDARREQAEKDARILEKQAQDLVDMEENGYTEPDTGAFIWINHEAECAAEELDEAAQAIRALKIEEK